MRESDIVYENRMYFLLRTKSKNAQIAPIGSIYFQLWRTVGVVSESYPFYVSSNLERAKKACDYWASCANHTILSDGRILSEVK